MVELGGKDVSRRNRSTAKVKERKRTVTAGDDFAIVNSFTGNGVDQENLAVGIVLE